ncbi:MAG: hypothetical protein RL272_807 [Candidatus Parcubacteria bacterium]|jgi:putative oxidoreductase
MHSKKHDAALLALRMAAGVIFIVHGYGKLFGNAPGMKMFTGMVAGLHFPAPALFAYLAALSEFCGGIALVLGVFPQVASLFLAIVMLVALIGVKKFSLPKADPDVALLAMVSAIGLMGAGRYSLQAMLSKKMEAEPVRAE